ncbi:hypothetical protein BDM02DRAFT_76909 [Thelephora ganbajun]|uniref:Uncharacterized protein n=1 Tax=Thelephora ganbajun TaxID=370292 RepID=A0ACB6ZWT6_THEGA|nr:hypothetical protein BDM02DRAFT_76909 [Thelephora ganbajun]
MRRKYASPASPLLYFKDDILSVPGYTFERAVQWDDTGSATLVAEGVSLKDGSRVLAKIAAAHSNGSMCLEREAHILGRMATSSESINATLRLIEFFTIPRSQGDCVVLLLVHPGINSLGRYYPPTKVNDILLGDLSRVRTLSHGDMYMMDDTDMAEEVEACDMMDLATFLEFAIQATHCLELLHRNGFTHREGDGQITRCTLRVF